MEFLGQCPADESGSLQLVSWRVQLSGDRPVWRGQPPLHGTLLESSGQVVSPQTLRPEAVEHRRGGESGKIPQRFQTQAAQEVNEGG
jgi:hypothetical protein